MNFEALEHWKELPTEGVLLYSVYNQVDVKEAKLGELQSWFDHNVYVEVPNDGFSQKNLSTEIRQQKLVLLQGTLKKTILPNCAQICLLVEKKVCGL